MKILLLTDSLKNGGAERQLFLLCKYLPKEIDKLVWTLDDGIYLQDLISNQINVKVCKRKQRFDISPAIDLYKIINEYRPDVIHAWGWMSEAAAIFPSKIFNIPLIDGTIRLGQKPVIRANVEKIVRLFANKIIANSLAGLNSWKINNERGAVIYNGFDPIRFDNISDSKNNDGFFRVVMTGRMVPEKDFSSFIESARIISTIDKKILFFAIGDGKMRGQLISDGQDLITSGIIEFPEVGKEPIQWVSKSDVGVLLTNPLLHAEGCSNSIMEYMACKIPVICTNGGGNNELVEDGENGFIIPPLCPQKLVEKLLFLKNNPEICSRMGNIGKLRFAQMFSVETMIQKTISIYNEQIHNENINS
jgi:glycosyltransferase involved in cell wall biosynthesis